jgi:mannose-6-phosphate isomerase-like protein (cupin superfamily)
VPDTVQIVEHWGDPTAHMAGYWSAEKPVIAIDRVPVETGAARMGPGFRLQKVVYTKTFMWDWDSMAPRLGTPLHRHYQDEAWYFFGGEGFFRVDDTRYRIRAGDVVFLPGDAVHQLANTSHTEPLLYQVVLAPPVAPDSIVVVADFDPADLDAELVDPHA